MITIGLSSCLTDLSTWLYCGWDGGAGVSCCNKMGVPLACHSLCNATSAACHFSSSNAASLIPCIRYKSSIFKCQLQSMQLQSNYDLNWNSDNLSCNADDEIDLH